MRKSIFLFMLMVTWNQIQAQTHGYLEYNFMLKNTDEVLGVIAIHSYGNNTYSVTKYENGGSRVSMYLAENDSVVYSIAPDKSYWVQPDRQLNEYAIQIIGDETIGGYNCTKLAVATHNENKLSNIIWYSYNLQ